jgi:glycosyltransferase involved in cell wall biosynthesis
MRIGVDARPLEGVRTGVGRYVWELCRALDSVTPDATFFLYSRRPVQLPATSYRWIPRTDDSPAARAMRGIPWLKLMAGRLVTRDNPDVFWGTTGFLPYLPKGIRTVSTVYDLNYKIVPQTMPLLHRWSHRVFFERDVLRADFVCAISRGTAEKLERMFGVREVSVVYPAASPEFTPPATATTAAILARYQICRPYFLAVGTLEPRKNFGMLLEAFLGLQEQGVLREHTLVITGASGWGTSGLANTLQQHRSVKALGYVPDEHLPALYAGSEALIFPSLYEGFGMPVLEARLCAARVVASDLPELREAGDEHVTYVQPDVKHLQAAMLQIASDGKRPPPATPPRTWAESARVLASILRAALKGG